MLLLRNLHVNVSGGKWSFSIGNTFTIWWRNIFSILSKSKRKHVWSRRELDGNWTFSMGNLFTIWWRNIQYRWARGKHASRVKWSVFFTYFQYHLWSKSETRRIASKDRCQLNFFLLETCWPYDDVAHFEEQNTFHTYQFHCRTFNHGNWSLSRFSNNISCAR